MTVYRVKFRRSASRDMDELEDFLKSVMSKIGANKYIDNMFAEEKKIPPARPRYRRDDISGRISPNR